MSLCSCDVSLQNTGSPSCAPIMGVAANFILVPLIANDGTFNYIDPTATLNDAYFTALINEADDSKRWYPTGKLKNVTTDRADPILETFEDGSSVFIRDGIRNFTAMIIKGSFELAKQFNANRCSTFGIFIVDLDGNILGTTKTGSDYLYPIACDAATFYAKPVFTTDTTIQKIMLMGQWDVLQKDDDLRMISASSISAANIVNLKGLMNVYATIVSTSATTMVLDLYAKVGNIVTNYPIEGLVTANFVSSDTGTTSSMYNITDNSDLSVTAAESTTIDGRYTLTYTGAVASEVLQPLIKKNGLDGVTMLGTTGTVI
jgi:hypothetical protein